MENNKQIQYFIQKELHQKLKQYKKEEGYANLGIATCKILKAYFANKENKDMEQQPS